MARVEIQADDLRLDAAGPDVILSCRVRSTGPALPPRLWFQVPAALASQVAVNGDPLIPVLAVTSMRWSTRLIVDGDVSKALLEGSRRVMATFQQRGEAAGDGLTIPEVSARGVQRTDRGGSSGAFFSGGVDSFFTLIRNHARSPADDPRRIHHLLLIHGFDIPLAAEDAFDEALRHARDVADALGIRAVPIRTNAKDFVQSLDWGLYGHGPVLASVGLVLQGLLHTIYVPSTYWPGVTATRRASDPETDPLWSTETLEFVHDVQADRFEKVRLLSSSSMALRSLRVCWENRGTAYNCGRCEKCLRTMFSLKVLGALEQARQFPHEIDVQAVQRLALTAVERPLWSRALEEGRRAGMDPALLRAVEGAMARGRWADSRAGRLDRALSSVLSGAGLTGETVKRWDGRLSRGAGTRLFRWLQLRLGGRRDA